MGDERERSSSLGGSNMSEHAVKVEWKRETPDFEYQTYNRDHDWAFDAGITVRASANPDYKGSDRCVDPEEAFVASLSSCHMLTFLALAARDRYVVDRYRDQAVGVLGKDSSGHLAMTRVTLRPEVAFSGEKVPSAEEIRQLHDRAHHACFIANSVKTDVIVEPQ
jgi:organic hydroperoxide reductase OsmC/OhrA